MVPSHAKAAALDLTLRSLKSEEQIDFWDTRTPGFGVRVGKRSKTFIAKVLNRRATLGSYPALSLQEARRRFFEVKVDASPDETKAPPFREAVETYLASRTWREGTRAEGERLLAKHFPFKARPLDKITTRDIDRVLDSLRATPSECLHTFKAIRTFFRWAVGRRYVDRSPCEGMPAPTKEVAKDRTLDPIELGAVWQAAERYGNPFGTIVQLLITTGQRRGEIGGLRSEYVDYAAKTITFPATLTKNGRKHTIPISDRTVALLKRGKPTGLLFPARNSSLPFSGFSTSKICFDKKCQIEPWTLHDLRRTFASNLASLGVRIEVTEKLLNHVSGTMGGIVGVYQRYDFKDEMRAPVDLWEDKLRAIVSAGPYVQM